MDDWKAKQAAKSVAAAALQVANPHLVAVSTKVDSLQAAAKNIRIELKRAFPTIKFSVRSSRFSMGDSIDVSWVDGPIAAQVDEIIGCYAAGSFDGMDDSYTYASSAWTDAFGDAKYVHCSRDSSDKAVASAARFVCARYGIDAAEGVVAAYRKGALRTIHPGSGCYDLGDLIGQEISRRTWALSKAPKPTVVAQIAAMAPPTLLLVPRAADGGWLQ